MRGMRPSVWGPILWNTMHIISLGYPETPDDATQQAAANFYRSLSFLIPCPICRDHYAKLIQMSPPATESKDALIKWVFTIHNEVNKQLGKVEISYDAFMNHMESLSHESSSTFPMITGIAIGIGLSAVVYYMCKK
jgi:hypothetical protein